MRLLYLSLIKKGRQEPMLSISILKRISLSILILGIVAAARAQTLAGAESVEALQRDGYVIVMRHASSPQTAPTKETANPDNPGDER
jgi:hypothetical protein